MRRRADRQIAAYLDEFPAVALLGPRQVGKTTLAHMIGETREHVYLDLETPVDRAKLIDADSYFTAHESSLVILDEVQRVPEIFATIRGAIDRGRRRGRRTARFLLLGSASKDLLRQSGESLAGRIAYSELCGFDALEIGGAELDALFLRGGFPESYLARTDATSARWREHFVRTYLERDIPQLGPRIPAETLRRFWTMLAHSQGGLFNAAAFARGLDVEGKTTARYLDLMVDLLLVRTLPPLHANVSKRLVKSPKVYVRDSGIAHSLLGIETFDDLLGHPVVGASWEGFVVENVLAATPAGALASFYRTIAGAEIDLVLDIPGRGRLAIEIKRSAAPTLSKGNRLGFEDLGDSQKFVVYAGEDRFSLGQGVDAVGLAEMMRIVIG